ncbi:unnamed protein product [Ceratitis capitata]|uniref:(Mediterranean fruit fly) hypothetical protein n=1 Tax=Ceratitis capitata TaxID=7213 RepID=A0A811V6U8_CERCA|nr:unnamed protein product [Ceratitis capitata]
MQSCSFKATMKAVKSHKYVHGIHPKVVENEVIARNGHEMAGKQLTRQAGERTHGRTDGRTDRPGVEVYARTCSLSVQSNLVSELSAHSTTIHHTKIQPTLLPKPKAFKCQSKYGVAVMLCFGHVCLQKVITYAAELLRARRNNTGK